MAMKSKKRWFLIGLSLLAIQLLQVPEGYSLECQTRTRHIRTLGRSYKKIDDGNVVRVSSERVLQSIAWNGQRYVAVGNTGTIVTSDDGIHWKRRSAPTSSALYGVIWGGGQFVAVGRKGTILTSTTGAHWRKRTSKTRTDLVAIASDGQRFAVVGPGVHSYNRPYNRSGIIGSSTDGRNWVWLDVGAAHFLSDVTWSGSRFIAVGKDSILTSSDGLTWTTLRPDGQPPTNWWAVTSNGKQTLVLGENGETISSTDGNEWTSWVDRRYLYPDVGRDISWNGSQFVLLTYYVFQGAGIEKDSYRIHVSPDGKSWKPLMSNGTILTDGGVLNEIIWNGSRFVAVGSSGGRYRQLAQDSPDSILLADGMIVTGDCR